MLLSLAWADNADVVGRAYSGTGALKIDFTRAGARTKARAIANLSNSINLPSATAVSSLLLFDRRPIIIQSISYVLCGAILLELVAFVLPRTTDGSLLSMGGYLFFFWLFVAFRGFLGD